MWPARCLYAVAVFLGATLISVRGAREVISDVIESNSETKVAPSTGNSTEKQEEGGIDNILCEYYSGWTKWSICNRKCEQSRVRRCRRPDQCGRSWLKEKRTCKRRKGGCSVLSYKLIGFRRRNRVIEQLLYDLLYSSWSAWGPCTRTCKQRRKRKCTMQQVCRKSYIQEERRCRVAGTRCERRYLLKPIGKGDDSKSGHPSVKPTETTLAKGKNHTGKKEHLSSPTLDKIEQMCGVRPANISGSYRVVGGQEAQRLSWPWQVGIMTRWEEPYCGGTLITPQWVLTAAHCVRKKGRKRRVIVRVGEHDFGVYEGTEDDRRKSKDFAHPRFDYTTITNDIALLKLKKPVNTKHGLGFACLPDEKDDYRPGTVCYTVGWGKLKNTHIYGSDSLQEARVPLVDQKRCQRVFDYDITSTQVCAGHRKGGVDSCAGDSGGPLMCSKTVNGTVRWFVYGVTSYGEGCGRRGKYGIYTKVSMYLKWIYSTIEEN